MDWMNWHSWEVLFFYFIFPLSPLLPGQHFKRNKTSKPSLNSFKLLFRRCIQTQNLTGKGFFHVLAGWCESYSETIVAEDLWSYSITQDTTPWRNPETPYSFFFEWCTSKWQLEKSSQVIYLERWWRADEMLWIWEDWGVTSCRCCTAKKPDSGAKVFKGNSWPSYLLALDSRSGGDPITLKECPKKKALKITPLENKNENEDPLKHGCLLYFLHFPWEGTWNLILKLLLLGKHGKQAMGLMIVEKEKRWELVNELVNESLLASRFTRNLGGGAKGRTVSQQKLVKPDWFGDQHLLWFGTTSRAPGCNRHHQDSSIFLDWESQLLNFHLWRLHPGALKGRPKLWSILAGWNLISFPSQREDAIASPKQTPSSKFGWTPTCLG